MRTPEHPTLHHHHVIALHFEPIELGQSVERTGKNIVELVFDDRQQLEVAKANECIDRNSEHAI